MEALSSSLFLKIANMSINATWLIAAVMLLRLALKNAPKSLRCLMWGIVALRLVLPFSIESVLSLLPSAQTLPDNILYTASPVIDSGVPIIDNTVNPILSTSLAPQPVASANPTQILSFVFSQVWILGMVLMGLYALLSWAHVRRKVSASVSLSRDVRICDYIDSPFILGFFRPVIYLPSSLEEGSKDYVMAHERSHLKRRDHWWKPLGFLLLTVHWFNPAVWAAYILLCRDIELACDERVIRQLGAEQKQAYSSALLSCSIRRPYIAACPLAFGEVGVRQRIKSVLNYRKPGFWIVAVSVIACAVAAVCFLTDPVSGRHTLEGTTIVYKTDGNGRITSIRHSEADATYTIDGNVSYPHGAVNKPFYLLPNGEIRDDDGNPVDITYLTIYGLIRETDTRLTDAWVYSQSDKTFTIQPGSDSLEELTLCSFPDIPQDHNLAALAGLGSREVCCISISSRVGITSLSSVPEMTDFAQFLSKFAYDPVPLSETPVSSDAFWAGSVRSVAPENRNSHYLEDMLLFSEDFSTVWKYSGEENGLPYSVLNPEGLAEYFSRSTAPARNNQVTAQPFATAEEPHLWLSKVHSEALEKVTCCYPISSLSTQSWQKVSTLSGYLTKEALDQLLPVLNGIPQDALTKREATRDFNDYYHRKGALSLLFYDRANDLAVIIHWDRETPKIITYEDLDKVINGYKCPDAHMWSIESPELTALLEAWMESLPSVSLFTTRDLVRYGPVEVICGGRLGSEGVEISIPRGWMLDFYSEDQGFPEILFRMHPTDVESGSVNALFYPKDTFSVGAGYETKTVQVGMYPATGYFYDGSDQWTYLHIPGRTCDLVFRFDAWGWEDAHTGQVMDILATLITGECMANEWELRTIGMSLPQRPKYNNLTPVLNSNGTWTIQYFDVDGNLVGEIITDLWGKPI
ncbi:MAG: hypothetical protein IJA75_06270 [Oscillospiraceae bacterium]|nr:hypothetical protein [Oscillospiraceae bacterium]